MNRRGIRRPIVVPRMLPESASSTPLSSALPSAYPSEEEEEGESSGKAISKATFPFLSLPSEIRNQIYSIYFSTAPPVIDLDPSTFRLIHHLRLFALFGVSRQVNLEATHHFFSTHTFRIFPTYPGKYFKTKKPLLARLPAQTRNSITSLELRLGPGWNNPPRGWVVNDALGLEDCIHVRTLKAFVECDPSDVLFQGFRKSEGFYEKFSADLLDGILKRVPSITVVEFDAYSSVMRNGDMMSGLGEAVSKYKKVVAWGPERGWDHEGDQVWLDALLMHGGFRKWSKNIAVLAH